MKFFYNPVHISAGHHNKKSEKQFAEGPGRKSASQQSFPIDDYANSDSCYLFDPQEEEIPAPAVTPTRSKSGGKRKKRAAKTVPSPNGFKNRPKRSAAAMKSPLKSDIYVGEEEDMDELSDSELEESDSAAGIVMESNVDTGMEGNNENTPVKYTEIVLVSDPVPVVPKLETYDPFQAQVSQGSAEFSREMEEFRTDNVIVKQEARLDIEAGTVEDEEDPDWEPGTKKRRKSSDSRSVTSPVDVVADQGQSKWCLSRFCSNANFSSSEIYWGPI